MSASRRYQSLQNEEWSALLKRPQALDTDSPEALETDALVKQLGLSHFILILRFVLPVAGPIQVALSNWRTDWYERYWAKNYLHIDPVVARMLTGATPFVWGDIGTPSPAQREFFADAARHGLVDGIAGSARFGSDQVGFFSVSSERPCTDAVKENAMAHVLLHTVRLYNRVHETLLALYQTSPIVLTHRQREALQLTLRGVSRRDAGRAMRCSESNFVRHQEAARRKLGESSNYNAVRKAVAMNLIRPYDTVTEESAHA
jgi:LuxR family transcriptional regulator, activator of conjugal transfer of Ti plasmids